MAVVVPSVSAARREREERVRLLNDRADGLDALGRALVAVRLHLAREQRIEVVVALAEVAGRHAGYATSSVVSCGESEASESAGAGGHRIIRFDYSHALAAGAG